MWLRSVREVFGRCLGRFWNGVEGIFGGNSKSCGEIVRKKGTRRIGRFLKENQQHVQKQKRKHREILYTKSGK
jgi:hypothetical protein